MLTPSDAADASDHEGAAKAIAKGLVRGHSKSHPGYWIHTGGTGILTFWDSRDDFKTLGSHSDREYNDLQGISELTSLPDDAFHRNVDKIVLEAGEKHGNVLRTCIVCPPTIYGMSHPCSYPILIRSSHHLSVFMNCVFLRPPGPRPQESRGEPLGKINHRHQTNY